MTTKRKSSANWGKISGDGGSLRLAPALTVSYSSLNYHGGQILGANLGQYFGQRGAVHLYRVRLDEMTPDDAVSAKLDVRVRLIPRQSRCDVVTDNDERVLQMLWFTCHCCHWPHTHTHTLDHPRCAVVIALLRRRCKACPKPWRHSTHCKWKVAKLIINQSKIARWRPTPAQNSKHKHPTHIRPVITVTFIARTRMPASLTYQSFIIANIVLDFDRPSASMTCRQIIRFCGLSW